ncbi:MAG: hypothetical protein AAB509_01275, partial [Patescibacteria group bacterium]
MKNTKKICILAFAVLACLTLLTTASPVAADSQTPNLVTNPGFESGMVGYSTTYAPYPGPYQSYGQAGVTTNPRLLQSNFSSFTGDGNFLVVNSSTNGSNEFICQNINVEQNKTYNFSVTSRSVYSNSSKALHAWYINGVAITGTITSSFNSWGTTTATWSSSSTTSARLCGKNMSRAYSGADFTIDNLVLQLSAPNCTPHYSQKCVGNNVYWVNSCGEQEELKQTCAGNQTCSAGSCVNQNITCST